MAGFVVGLVLVLAMAAHSDATYCVCNSGLSDPVLQKNIDYACGNGADCSAILQNGACYNPNTVKDHCNYAVNSYYQRKGQISGSCDFQNTATVTQTAPSAASGCVYQSSPSTGGGGTTPTIGTPSPPGMVSPPGMLSPPGTFPGSNSPPGVGMGPSGFDNGGGVKLLSLTLVMFVLSFTLSVLISGLIRPRI